jgi:hypothetical protein
MKCKRRERKKKVSNGYSDPNFSLKILKFMAKIQIQANDNPLIAKRQAIALGNSPITECL